MNRTLRTTCLLLACCMAPTLHASILDPNPYAFAEDDFTRGTQALDQQRWQDAITSFDRVVQSKSKKSDAALYWKAYALNKLGRSSLVSSTCSQLSTVYTSSSWNKDCAALFVAGSPDAAHIAPDESSRRGSISSDADLKALALNSLLNRDPAQALPIIRNILSGNSSPELKHRAISILAQNPSPDAQAIVREVATGKFTSDEQKRAIQMMAVFQGKRGNDILAEVYHTSNDHVVKRAVISAFFASGDAERMVDLARNEKDLTLKHDIVAQLALMHEKAATDYMIELLK